VEVGLNTSTIALQVIGSDQRGITGTFLEDINVGRRPSGWDSLESDTAKYGHESHGV
jgi:hypothetical protein